ncbi:MAG TPA: UDP-N-acetylmuramate--L-alanine ligase [Acidimicrobiales bacterium]
MDEPVDEPVDDRSPARPPSAGAEDRPGVTPVDLGRPRRIHVVGVGGSGMGPIARVLAAMGHDVRGSDQREPADRAGLEAAGITVYAGHDAAHVGDAELLACSTAVPATNPEVVAAREAGIPVLRRADVLAAVAATKRTIAVAGTHGKTTTSAMLAHVLLETGVRPSFIVGGTVTSVGSGAQWDDGEWFVVEADESDGTFLELGAEIAIVTNVEPDHLEHYGGFEPLVAAFRRFLAEARGSAFVGADDELAARLGREAGATLVGAADDAAVRMAGVRPGAGGVDFDLARVGEGPVAVHVPLPGVHNARNGALALAAAAAVGVDLGDAAKALGTFAGVGRRFERRGEAAGVTLVDDYAHLPTEVEAALAAARDGGWERVVCVFQPHRYSRTQALWRDFADSFGDADLLAVTDIYASGEAPRPGVSGKLIVDAVLDAHPWKHVAYLPRLDDVVVWLRGVLRPGDLCLTLGAGDLTTLPPRILEMLEART